MGNSGADTGLEVYRLWRSLAADDVGGDLVGMPFEELEARGMRQFDAAEEQRLPVARRALRD